MNILILGSGGREHALAWKMAVSPLTDELYCAPGNAGIAREAECVTLDLADHKAVIAFAKDRKIDLVVVGPEVPLCAGITGTMGGVVIDAQARAQKREGGVFDGLYAVGTPVAGLEGGPRAGYVGGLSKAFILGLLAAEQAVTRAARQEKTIA